MLYDFNDFNIMEHIFNDFNLFEGHLKLDMIILALSNMIFTWSFLVPDACQHMRGFVRIIQFSYIYTASINKTTVPWLFTDINKNNSPQVSMY